MSEIAIKTLPDQTDSDIAYYPEAREHRDERAEARGTIRWAGPTLIGHAFNSDVLHIIELTERPRRDGKVPPGVKNGRKMMTHDPRQITCRDGRMKEPSKPVDDACSAIGEMKGAGNANLCCGGGGGVSANQRAQDLMIGAFDLKMAQIDKLGGVDAVVPCANCRGVFEHGLFEQNREGVEVSGRGQLVADTLVDDPPAPAQ